MVSEKPSVRAPEFWEPRPAYRTKQRDAYFRQTRGIDPAILADELGLNEAFVRMYQRKLGIRACMQKPRRGTAMIRFIAVNDRTPRMATAPCAANRSKSPTLGKSKPGFCTVTTCVFAATNRWPFSPSSSKQGAYREAAMRLLRLDQIRPRKVPSRLPRLLQEILPR